MVGNWSTIQISAPFAHHLLLCFVVQNEMEQQMVRNWLKIRIFAPSAPFVVPFCFTERNVTTNGWQFVEN